MISRNCFNPVDRLKFFAVSVCVGLLLTLSGCASIVEKNAAKPATPAPVATSTPILKASETRSLSIPTPMPSFTFTPPVNLTTPPPVQTKTPTRTQLIQSTHDLTTPQPTQPGKSPLDPSAQPQSLLILDPIQIHSPAEGSWLLSPIPVDLEFLLGNSGKIIRIELRNDRGELLYRKIVLRDQLSPPGDRYNGQIDFEIPQEFNNASLTIALEDEPGMPLAVYTNHVRLLSSGMQKLTPFAWQAKAIDIQQPYPNATASGGTLDVNGLTRLDAADPIKVQIINLEGKVIGQRLAEIDVQPGAAFDPFQAQLTYKVSRSTPARVVVFRSDPQSGETQYLASQPVLLMP